MAAISLPIYNSLKKNRLLRNDNHFYVLTEDENNCGGRRYFLTMHAQRKVIHVVIETIRHRRGRKFSLHKSRQTFVNF